MHLSTEFASDNELLDRVMDKGIVVEVWDQLGLAAIDLAGMHVSISVLQVFDEGKHRQFRPGYFLKVEPS